MFFQYIGTKDKNLKKLYDELISNPSLKLIYLVTRKYI